MAIVSVTLCMGLMRAGADQLHFPDMQKTILLCAWHVGGKSDSICWHSLDQGLEHWIPTCTLCWPSGPPNSFVSWLVFLLHTTCGSNHRPPEHGNSSFVCCHMLYSTWRPATWEMHDWQQTCHAAGFSTGLLQSNAALWSSSKLSP